MRRFRAFCAGLTVAQILAGIATASAADDGSVQSYDEALCSLAQRYLVNAESDPDIFDLKVLYAEGIGFHTIQMDADRPEKTVTIATTKTMSKIDGKSIPAYVSCKMINRDRAADILELRLGGEARTCRDVNEFTYQKALEGLTEGERRRYLERGKPLVFTEDHVTAGGSEWLPAPAENYIKQVWPKDHPTGFLEVSAPSVQVPWNAVTREFYQGTQHCKLLTMEIMQHWMRNGAFDNRSEIIPATRQQCLAPSSDVSKAGSCHFYFAPADAMFCNDYSGPSWTREKAREECGKRHASRAALEDANAKYQGKGGVYSLSTCAERDDIAPIEGTCVFQCNQTGETQWRSLTSTSPAGDNAMMSKACDLFIPGPPGKPSD